MTFTARLNLHDLFSPAARCPSCGMLAVTILAKNGTRQCARCGASRADTGKNTDDVNPPQAVRTPAPGRSDHRP